MPVTPNIPPSNPSAVPLPAHVQAQLSDIQTIRERARHHINDGAVTHDYQADRDTVLRLLDEAMATEIVCSLRHKRHYHTAKGLTSASIAQEFLEHAHEEEDHADLFADRITQLGGDPDYSPDTLSRRSHAEYVEGQTLVEMIREDLIAERIAIDSYKEIINYLGTSDPTTRRLFEQVLAVEEEHAEELQTLIHQIGSTEGRSES